ncbi:hypothetical protein D3C80_1108640 [compost metagenome]
MARESSMMMNRPVIRSATSDCAPKPMARPITPAPASKGVTFMPMLARATIRATMKIATNRMLRISGIMVCARALARPLRERVMACCRAASLRIHTSQAPSRVRPRPNSLAVNWWSSLSVSPINDKPQTRSPSSMKANHTSKCTRV